MGTKVCENGHVFYKTSDCPVCPKCEELKKPDHGFMAGLAAPARRALENSGIDSLKKLSTYSESEILSLHGFGKSSLPHLRSSLEEIGLQFKKS